MQRLRAGRLSVPRSFPVIMLVVYHVTCVHRTEATLNGRLPHPLEHPYNTIGNENLDVISSLWYFFSFLTFLSDFCHCVEFLFMWCLTSLDGWWIIFVL